MKTFLNVKAVCVAGVCAGLLTFAAPTASAGDYCHATRHYYKTITVYETVKKPYRYSYTKFTSCGHRYTTWATAWKTVRVPVQRRVRVAY